MILLLVSYDVRTDSPAGRKRLRRVAGLCVEYGQRVQLSVFEVRIQRFNLDKFKKALVKEILPQEDSLRFYDLGSGFENRVEHHGVRKSTDFQKDVLLA